MLYKFNTLSFHSHFKGNGIKILWNQIHELKISFATKLIWLICPNVILELTHYSEAFFCSWLLIWFGNNIKIIIFIIKIPCPSSLQEETATFTFGQPWIENVYRLYSLSRNYYMPSSYIVLGISNLEVTKYPGGCV